MAGNNLTVRKKYDDFSIVTSFGNLYNAHLSCRKGKLWKDSVAHYELTDLEYTVFLQRQLKNKSYKVSAYHCFQISERGKTREIKSTRYRDRVVQKVMHDDIYEPYIFPKLVYENGASQLGKGTKFQLDLLKKHLQEEVSKHGTDSFILIGDFHNYFGSLPHDVLHNIYCKYFSDPALLDLIDAIHDSIPGNRGVPLGNQQSQTDALLAINSIDHIVKEQLHIRGYGRYQDDFYLIHHDRSYLEHCLSVIQREVDDLGLELNSKKTKIVSIRQGIDFLGFHVYVTKTGKVVVRIKTETKKRERNKIKAQRRLVDAGEMTFAAAKESYQCWRSHASWGDTFYMLQAMDLYFLETYKSYLSPEEKKFLRKLKAKADARMQKRRQKCQRNY